MNTRPKVQESKAEHKQHGDGARKQQPTAVAAMRMQQALLSDKGLDLRDKVINAKLF